MPMTGVFATRDRQSRAIRVIVVSLSWLASCCCGSPLELALGKQEE